MPTRASKKSPKEDEVQAAVRVIRTVTEKTERPAVDPAVSAAASALSKLGASKGGEARAASLSKKRRSEIAKAAAAARWSGQNGGKQ
jgi:hypothetical protein